MKKFIKYEGRLSLAIPLLGMIGGDKPKSYSKPKALVLVGMESDGRMRMSAAGKKHAKSLEALEAEHEEALRRLAKREEREASEHDEPTPRTKTESLAEIEAARKKRREAWLVTELADKDEPKGSFKFADHEARVRYVRSNPPPRVQRCRCHALSLEPCEWCSWAPDPPEDYRPEDYE